MSCLSLVIVNVELFSVCYRIHYARMFINANNSSTWNSYTRQSNQKQNLTWKNYISYHQKESHTGSLSSSFLPEASTVALRHIKHLQKMPKENHKPLKAWRVQPHPCQLLAKQVSPARPSISASCFLLRPFRGNAREAALFILDPRDSQRPFHEYWPLHGRKVFSEYFKKYLPV